MARRPLPEVRDNGSRAQMSSTQPGFKVSSLHRLPTNSSPADFFIWRGTSRAEPGYFSAAKKRGLLDDKLGRLRFGNCRPQFELPWFAKSPRGHIARRR